MSQVTITTEQVHELIEQLAAMTAAASITPEIVANIFEKMRQLNDQEKDKIIAITQAYLQELNQAGIVGFISRETTQSEEEVVVFKTDNGIVVGTVGPSGADFINLKRGGQQVARMSDLPTKDTSIGDTPSTTHVPTTAAVKEYVDENSMKHLPMSEESTQSEDEEFVASNDAGTDTYVKMGDYGVKAKAYFNLQGNPIFAMQNIDGENVLIFS